MKKIFIYMVFMRIDVSVKGFLEDVWPGVEEIKKEII